MTLNSLRLCFAFFLFLIFSSMAYAEVPRYEIQAAVDTHARQIDASQTVTFTNNTTQDTNEVYFHIYPNRQYSLKEKAFMLRYASYFKIDPFPEGFPETKFNVSNISINGQEAASEIKGDDKSLLKVSLPQPLKPGESVTLSMDFSLKIPHSWGRFGWHNNITAMARWYPILAVYEEEGWDEHPFYPFHRPFHSDAAHYKVTLKVPSDEVVIHSGDMASESLEGEYKTIQIETSNPIREFSLALSPRYKVVESQKDGITFKAYYLEGNEARAHEAMGNAQDLFANYTKQFGAYPYKQFSIAPVHLGYGGEQMSNLIFIDVRVFELPKILHRYFDFLIAHESGHQWFYNIVGANNYMEMWLEEGVNSYFLLNYLEEKYGKDADVLDLSRMPKWVGLFVPHFTFRRAQESRYKIATRVGFERPIISKLSSFNEPSSIFTMTYGKGSKVVSMLKTTVGEENFQKIFARIFDEYKFKNVSLEDFVRISEEVSGMELDWFFDQWLKTKNNFDPRITQVKGNEVTIARRGGISMPVNVHVDYKDGSQEDLVWDGKAEVETLSLKGPIRRVNLDENKDLLDVDRTNNSWPRKLNFMVLPLYHPLYDLPVTMPDEKYNLIVGPEISNGVGIRTSFQKPYDFGVYAAQAYDFGDQIGTTKIGGKIDNFMHSQTTFGIEDIETVDYDNGEYDLSSQKVYLRKELWPAPYGLTQINDHATLYAIRNRTPSGSLLSSEEISNTSYLKKNESIVGALIHMSSARPWPDPRAGNTVDVMVENSGHWAGATQAFTRASIDTRTYRLLTPRTKMAFRLKYGWGSHDDKNLYELGGIDGLRGYGRKEIRGSDMLLGSAEYRFPLISGLNASAFDRLITLKRISGVAFFDAGQSWRDSFSDAKFKKDAGLGIRFHVSVGSFLEDIILRLDVAKPIDDSKEDAHTWFGINHAF